MHLLRYCNYSKHLQRTFPWCMMQELMVEVEVRAAHNVVEACAQVDTIERVVFTSSVTAVVWKENRKLAADVDEREWSEPNFCRKFKVTFFFLLHKTSALYTI